MKQAEYNALTRETTIAEVPDVEMPVTEVTDAKAEAIEAIESATTVAGLRAAMLNYINAG
jgi:LmbE family N-acetylglucosaminyl deacetylase